VEKNLHPSHTMLQWRPTKGEDIPTPNTKEIVVLLAFFQHGFGLPTCEFLCGLLHHYQIELVHLNPNSILHIVIFVCLCKAFLIVPPNFPLFKSYFFLKYHPSAVNRQIISGVGIQTCHRNEFLDLPMKTSIKGWNKSWFYCESHEPSLPPFISRLSEYQKSWIAEPTSAELLIVAVLANRVSDIKRHDLTGVCVASNWLAHRVTPL
jgi:hypothetical protein